MIPGFGAVRAELEARGFRPSRRLGQNFLKDPNLARAIAADADPRPGEAVLEVGPGPGVLTAALLERGARVLAVEIDGRLVEVLRAVLGEPEGLELVHADALASKHRLAPELASRLPAHGDWQVVSNLPYSAGTPVVLELARTAHPPRRFTVLLQAELARRLAADPGSGDYGAVSVRIQARYRPRALREVAPALFWPRPQVRSLVLQLERYEPGAGPVGAASPAELAALDRLVGHCFGGRRKTLRRLLAAVGAPPGALQAAGLDGGARPEEIDAAGFLSLARQPGPWSGGSAGA